MCLIIFKLFWILASGFPRQGRAVLSLSLFEQRHPRNVSVASVEECVEFTICGGLEFKLGCFSWVTSSREAHPLLTSWVVESATSPKELAAESGSSWRCLVDDLVAPCSARRGCWSWIALIILISKGLNIPNIPQLYNMIPYNSHPDTLESSFEYSMAQLAIKVL